MQELTVPQGTFRLDRWPRGGDPTLRAWDAADDLVLHHLAEAGPAGRTLVVNDAFGALVVALGDRPVVSWGDSEVSRRGAISNLDRNGRHGQELEHVPADRDPEGPFDVAVVKVPRSLSLLEDQLRRLRPLLARGATVVGAGMVKHVHSSTLALFEQAIGPTTTSLARRKARLIHAELDPDLVVEPAPPPLTWSYEGLTVVNRAGVFARERADLGARALLAHLPAITPGSQVLDLGCGNGLLGAVAASRGAVVTFVDDSPLAVASSRDTMAASLPDASSTHLVADATDGLADASFDLVLCNPPFHAQGARVHDVAWRMISGAHRVLRPGGRLLLVGNRNLEHHTKASRVFGTAEVVSSDPKFVVVAATR